MKFEGLQKELKMKKTNLPESTKEQQITPSSNVDGGIFSSGIKGMI